MIPPSAAVRNHRKRVIEDAYEMVAALEVVRPLTSGGTSERLRRVDNWHVPIALRRILSRTVALAMLRLLDDSKPGRTGKSAGIHALLDSALEHRALTEKQRDRFRAQLNRVKGDFASSNFTFAEFVRFRHAHLGHSLIPHKPLSGDLMAHDLFARGEALLRLISSIEAQFSRNGVQFGQPAMEKRADWKRRSAIFWRHATRRGTLKFSQA